MRPTVVSQLSLPHLAVLLISASLVALSGCGDDRPARGFDAGGSDAGAADGVSPDGSDSCTDAEKRCAGANVEVCASGAWVVETSCAIACTAGACEVPAECAGTETRCLGNDRQICTDGTYATTETCDGGCSAGNCIVGPCTDGTLRCNGDDLEVCGAETFTLVESCEDGCLAEMCNACADGETQCDGEDLQTCGGGAFVTTETCAFGCDMGACRPAPECMGSEMRCSGDDAQTCMGGSFVTTETCTTGCTAGVCEGCTMGAQRCTGANEIESCVDGSSWRVTDRCASTCAAGACTGSVTCTPGQTRCSGNTTEICNSAGSAYLYLSTCPVSCSMGLCAGACTPGERRCNAAAVEECAADGTGWMVSESCTLACDAPSRTCILSGLEIASNTNLDGEIVVDGAVIVRTGATVTSPTGDLTIRATSITVELEASIIATPTSSTPRGTTGRSTSNSCSVGNGSQGSMPSESATASDVRVGPGGPGGAGGFETDFGGSRGGTGGLGGGVIRLVADTITIEGTVRADGSAGGGGTAGGGGGGGSGGNILVVAPSLTATGSLSVQGGAGGINRRRCGSSPPPAPDGAVGFVKTFSDSGGAVTGTIAGSHVRGQRPPLTITSSTHPNPSLVYNDGFANVLLSWSRPSAVTGYYHTLDSVRGRVPTSATGTFAATEFASLDPTTLRDGGNFFHIVPVNAISLPGTIQNYFYIRVNDAPPSARSTSHPTPTAWNPSANPFFEWTLPHPVANYRGFYYVLDQFGDTVPDETNTWLDASQQQILLAGIAPGIHMFHVISIDQQGYPTQAAAHVRVQVGADPGAGTIYGRVRGTGAADIPGANVTINRGLLRATNPDATTLANGAYNMMDVSVGEWEVTVTAAGYLPLTQNVIVTDAGMTASDFNLMAE